MKINSNTKLSEILENKNLVEVLKKYQLPCFSCPFAKFEMEGLTLGQVCRLYGVDEKSLIEELNKKIK